MNKIMWDKVIKAYIWSVTTAATDFDFEDMDIMQELFNMRGLADDEELRLYNKSESDYNDEYETVLKK